MHRQGYSLQEISNVTKHKNIASLKHYLDALTHKDKENYSNCLFKYIENSKDQTNNPNDSDDLDDLEVPPS